MNITQDYGYRIDDDVNEKDVLCCFDVLNRKDKPFLNTYEHPKYNSLPYIPNCLLHVSVCALRALTCAFPNDVLSK